MDHPTGRASPSASFHCFTTFLPDDTAAPGAREQQAALYDALGELGPSPVVELNRAVAIAMASGPAVGLELVDRLTSEPSLEAYHLLPVVRGDFLAKLGRFDEAREESGRNRGRSWLVVLPDEESRSGEPEAWQGGSRGFGGQWVDRRVYGPIPLTGVGSMWRMRL